MTLKGNVRTLRSLKRALTNLPITVSARIAARGAPAVTQLAGDAYDSGRTAYDKPRPDGVDGHKLSLVKSGASRAAMRFIATGRDMRTARLPRYTKYLIGKYNVLPNGPLPMHWRDTLTSIAADVLFSEINAHSEAGK